jgi:hypothetical protein
MVVGSFVLHQHVFLDPRLGPETKALRAPVPELLELPPLALFQMTALHKPFAFRTPHAKKSVGPKTFSAVESLLAYVADELKQKNIKKITL